MASPKAAKKAPTKKAPAKKAAARKAPAKKAPAKKSAPKTPVVVDADTVAEHPEVVDGQVVDVIKADVPHDPPAETDADAANTATAEGATDADLRAAAIANLAAGGDVDDEESAGGDDRPAPRVTPTGVVYEWGGDDDYLVVADLFNYLHDGTVWTARKGDVVRLPDPERGLELGVIKPVDD